MIRVGVGVAKIVSVLRSSEKPDLSSPSCTDSEIGNISLRVNSVSPIDRATLISLESEKIGEVMFEINTLVSHVSTVGSLSNPGVMGPIPSSNAQMSVLGDR